MKKTTRKLVLRCETIKVLRAIDSIALARARGGDAAAALSGAGTQSGVNCPPQALVLSLQSGDDCPLLK